MSKLPIYIHEYVYTIIMVSITVEPPIKDTPNKGHNKKKLYKGHILRSQSSTFLLYQYIFNLRREDNLSIKDKMPGPNVSFIRRFHCSTNARDGMSNISRDPNTKSHIVAENDFLGLQNTLEIVYGLLSIYLYIYVKTSYVPSVLHTGIHS